MSDEKSPGLETVLKWLDESEQQIRLSKGASAPLGCPGWAAKMLRSFQASGVAEMARQPSPGLQEILNWLDSKEGDYQVANEHEVGAPIDGLHGRAAKLPRFFHGNWATLKVANEALEAEVLRLRVMLGHMPKVHEIVDVAVKNGLDVRLVLSIGTPRPPETIEWRPCEVAQLWNVGLHDDPGFTVVGSKFIHTREGFQKTWRFHPEESE